MASCAGLARSGLSLGEAVVGEKEFRIPLIPHLWKNIQATCAWKGVDSGLEGPALDLRLGFSLCLDTCLAPCPHSSLTLVTWVFPGHSIIEQIFIEQ